MPRKRDAADELAQQMVRILDAQRNRGPDAYPLTLQRLANLADPSAPADLVAKAAAKKTFTAQILVAQNKNLAAPVALAEDSDRLAASPLLLTFVLGDLCSTAVPTVALARLKTRVVARLKQPFADAVKRQIETDNLPSNVECLQVKKTQHLHPLHLPLPRPPAEQLAEALVKVLEAQRRLGADSYPLTMKRLIDLTDPKASARLIQQALGLEPFRTRVLVAVKNQPDSPATLAVDRDQLAAHGPLLELLLEILQTPTHEVCSMGDLKKKVNPDLSTALLEVLDRQMETRTLPLTVGWLLNKKKPQLFLLKNVKGGQLPAAVAPAAARPADFGQLFAEAFERLDRQKGGHNFVSLLELRRALPLSREAFDAGLEEVRGTGRFVLSGVEGRHPLSPEERDGGLWEDGALLFHVSRKPSP
jgi:hypothetical protein